jgi:hypothetical protein
MGTAIFFLGLFLALILPLSTFNVFGQVIVEVGVIISAIGLVLIFAKK